MTRTIAILGIIACATISVIGLGVGTYVNGPGWLYGEIGLTKNRKQAAAKPAYSEHCIGRVVYLQFETAVVTKLKPDGKVWTCGGA
jgi:hypothetical protein